MKMWNSKIRNPSMAQKHSPIHLPNTTFYQSRPKSAADPFIQGASPWLGVARASIGGAAPGGPNGGAPLECKSVSQCWPRAVRPPYCVVALYDFHPFLCSLENCRYIIYEVIDFSSKWFFWTVLKYFWKSVCLLYLQKYIRWTL